MKNRSSSNAYKLGIAIRIIAAVIGGYILSVITTLLLAQLLPDNQGLLTGMLISFAIYAGAIIWSFAARNATRACGGIIFMVIILLIAYYLSFSYLNLSYLNLPRFYGEG